MSYKFGQPTKSISLVRILAMANIPVEILVDCILLRLPAKSLMRFKCVSKSWLFLISSPKFIKDHLYYNQTSNKNQLLILTKNDYSLYTSNLDEPEIPPLKLPIFGIEPFVVGSCDGLLCIQSHRPYSIVLLNPSTGNHRKIPTLLPPRRYSGLNYGFGYDSTTDDYKVVRIVDRYPSGGLLGYEMDRIVQMYSLRANSWEVIERKSPQDCMGSDENGVLIENHFLHWKFWCPIQGQYRILCFDLREKYWSHDVPLPDYKEVGSHTHSNHDNGVRDGLLDFGVLNGNLYLSTTSYQQFLVDIWVMNEYCVKESWVKMFKISNSRVNNLGSMRVSTIVYDSLKSQLLIRSTNKNEHKIWWYCVDGESLNSEEIDGFEGCIWIDVCKGSLVDVLGGSQIETTKLEDEEEGTSAMEFLRRLSGVTDSNYS